MPDGAAELEAAPRGSVAVGRRDVDHPVRQGLLRPALVHLDRTADELLAALPDRVRDAVELLHLGGPAEDRAVELAHGRDIARHQLAPDRRAGLAVRLVAVV